MPKAQRLFSNVKHKVVKSNNTCRSFFCCVYISLSICKCNYVILTGQSSKQVTLLFVLRTFKTPRGKLVRIYAMCVMCFGFGKKTCSNKRQAKDEDVSALGNEREKQGTGLIET